MALNAIGLLQAGDNLDLAWQNDTSQHKGFVPLEWLKQHRYPDETPVDTDQKQAKYKTMQSKPKKVSQLVMIQFHVKNLTQGMPEVDYEKVMAGDEGLWRLSRKCTQTLSLSLYRIAGKFGGEKV